MRGCYGRFADLYDRLMDDVDYDAWADSVCTLLGVYGETGGVRTVTDCACGTGAVTVRLAERGYRMTGIDLSPDMLRVAQDKARAHGLSIPFVQMDITAFRTHRKADAVICCCDGVNYLTGEERVRAFFNSANENLRDGGLLLFDLSTPFKLEHVLGCSTMGEDRKECTYLWENTFDPVSGLLEMRLHFFVPEGNGYYSRFDETHIQKSYSREQIGELLDRCGFTLLEAKEAFTGKEPEPECERIQYVARKKGNK